MRPVDLGDCERTRSTGLAQPANALSSLGFLPAAAWAWRAGRGSDARTGRALAVVMLANGMGSFWYHGPYSEAGARLHDAAAIAYPGLVAAVDAGDAPRLQAAVGGVTAIAALAALVDRRTTPLGAAAVGLALAGVEALRPSRGDSPARRTVGTVLVAAAGAYLLGRSDSPVCRPDSPFQAHATWHLLAAGAGVAWMRARLRSVR